MRSPAHQPSRKDRCDDVDPNERLQFTHFRPLDGQPRHSPCRNLGGVADDLRINDRAATRGRHRRRVRRSASIGAGWPTRNSVPDESEDPPATRTATNLPVRRVSLDATSFCARLAQRDRSRRALAGWRSWRRLKFRALRDSPPPGDARQRGVVRIPARSCLREAAGYLPGVCLAWEQRVDKFRPLSIDEVTIIRSRSGQFRAVS
jgi:hypothetical protein